MKKRKGKEIKPKTVGSKMLSSSGKALPAQLELNVKQSNRRGKRRGEEMSSENPEESKYSEKMASELSTLLRRAEKTLQKTFGPGYAQAASKAGAKLPGPFSVLMRKMKLGRSALERSMLAVSPSRANVKSDQDDNGNHTATELHQHPISEPGLGNICLGPPPGEYELGKIVPISSLGLSDDILEQLSELQKTYELENNPEQASVSKEKNSTISSVTLGGEMPVQISASAATCSGDDYNKLVETSAQAEEELYAKSLDQIHHRIVRNRKRGGYDTAQKNQRKQIRSAKNVDFEEVKNAARELRQMHRDKHIMGRSDLYRIKIMRN